MPRLRLRGQRATPGMARTAAVALAVSLVLTAGNALGKEPPEDLLGVSLGMAKEEVQKRLGKLGELDMNKEGPGGAKQFWKLRDRRYAWLAVRFDADMRVEWVSAFARQDKGRRPVRYRDIGNVRQAQLLGKYIYMWVVRKGAGEEDYAVTARGNDPEILSALLLYHTPKPLD